MKNTKLATKVRSIVKDEIYHQTNKRRLNEMEQILIPPDIDMFLGNVCKLKTFALVNYGQEGCINLLLRRPTILSKEQLLCIAAFDKFYCMTNMEPGLVLSFCA